MFDNLKYKFKQRKLQKQKDRIQTELDCARQQASDEHRTHDEIQSLLTEYLDELQAQEEAISALETGYLTAKARKYLLPIPSLHDGEYWKAVSYSGNSFVLTEKGISHLRSSIRAEKKERCDPYMNFILALITAIAGLIGIITGLISILISVWKH